MHDTVVVGIGNPFRGDDGAGPHVIKALQKTGSPVDLCTLNGNIAELLELFTRYPTIYLVDASFSTREVGSWRRIDARTDTLPPDSKQTSTHGFNVSQAIELAKTLHQLPERLIVYAIEGKRFDVETTLSPEVQRASLEVAHAITEEVSCTKRA